MKVSGICVADSPDRKRHTRLRASVQYADTSRSETYWFDVPADYADFVSQEGDPWLVLLLPLAARLGERLEVERPVCPQLVAQVADVTAIWRSWYRGFHDVPIDAPLRDRPAAVGTRNATFFSGGVDSFFSVLYERDQGQPPDDLVTVGGFDIPLDNPAAIQAADESLAHAAAGLGLPLITLSTNIRETRYGDLHWGFVTHGCALAAVGHAMTRRWHRVLIASSHGYHGLKPWGSHPLLDPLLSTAATAIVHHGTRFNRVEKTEFIARQHVALKHLHVCWVNRDEKNCCRCAKCMRTMATLELLGKLPEASSFSQPAVTAADLRHLRLTTRNEREFMAELIPLAEEKGRPEFTAMIRSLIRRGRFRERLGGWHRRLFGSRSRGKLVTSFQPSQV